MMPFPMWCCDKTCCNSHSRTRNIECEKDLRLSSSLLPFNDTHALSSCGRHPAKARHGEGRQKLRGKEASGFQQSGRTHWSKNRAPQARLHASGLKWGWGVLGVWMDGWRQTLRKCGVLKRMGVSRSTSPVWCAACVESLPRALALFENGGSGLPPSGTKQGASDSSQSVSGFLEEQTRRWK